MASVGIALSNQTDEIADVPLLDFMNALGAPIGNYIASQETGYSSTGSDFVDVFANERLHQLVDTIDHQAATRLLLLVCRVAAIEPGGEDLLRLGLGHRQCDASIRPNRIFAQP